ncbi:hypothetical protein GO495_09480 [Chitinophaga oryziterrae]|uniref:Uncharacterized protein n=1 Tax=Chitinophaga oryziterrae TaxID=1031224 RepID=A0A6N8J8G7_9BACT|nr:hypothetical protein [Chitinophaga oryziterrae]MVT40808.1 hypothetical protein [Chitinophaga oryziterrae]
MPKQLSTGKIKGTIGDLTFYKSQDGLMVKQKSEVSADRIATDPAYARTRENGREFGRAGKTGKVIRAAFSSLLSQVADNRVVSRLLQAIMVAQKSDTTSVRGERSIITGDATLLERFDFNIKSPLGAVLLAQFSAAVNRVTGAMTITIPAFVPVKTIKAPDGATHFKVLGAAAAIDFVDETFVTASSASASIAYGLQEEGEVTLTQNLPANSEDHLFLVLGIEFYQQFNGSLYPLNSGNFNALTIVKVDAA